MSIREGLETIVIFAILAFIVVGRDYCLQQQALQHCKEHPSACIKKPSP